MNLVKQINTVGILLVLDSTRQSKPFSIYSGIQTQTSLKDKVNGTTALQRLDQFFTAKFKGSVSGISNLDLAYLVPKNVQEAFLSL